MKPDFEVVSIGRAQSFRAWEHGYPFATVRWHFHPEYEIHQVVATSGRFFVGDFIGTFEPGNLVMTGPNLPHNWVSDLDAGVEIPLRNRVCQFSQDFVTAASQTLPELQLCREMLDRSRNGILFSAPTERAAEPIFRELVHATGIRRLEHFFGLLAVLAADVDARPLTSGRYEPDPSLFMAARMNEVLRYIGDNLTEAFSEPDLARIAGMNPAAFSRSFRRHTGIPLVRYVNRLRINLACQLLVSDEQMAVTDVCFASGFRNLSNFNRRFLAERGVSPTRFRALMEETVSPWRHLGRRRTA